MASHLDLEEQEQLDELKHFWKTYGNLISWALIVVLGAYAAWNGWNYWQRSQASKAAALYDEVERSVTAKDLARIERSMSDMKDKFSGTHQAHQAALLVARSLADQGQTAQAKTWLAWVGEQAPMPALREIARIRLAALQWESGSPDEALTTLAKEFGTETAPLAADLRGDLLLVKGQQAEAVKAYQKALQGLSETNDYRRVVQSKLAVQGVAVDSEARP